MNYKLSHKPAALVLNHRNNDLLVKTVAETEHEKSIGGMNTLTGLAHMYSIVHAVQDSDFAYSVMLLILTGNKHLGVCLQFLAVSVGYGIRKVHSAHKESTVAGQKRVIIFLGGLGSGNIVFMFLATASKEHKNAESEYDEKYFSH